MRISDWSSDVCSSDLVVIADATTPVEFAAIDVVLQAEHGPDGLAWLVTWDEAVADAVAEAVAENVPRSPRRQHLEATLAAGGYAVVCDGTEQALEIGRAHVRTPVTNAHCVCRTLLEKTKQTDTVQPT